MPLDDLVKRTDMSKYDESVVKDMPECPGVALTGHVMLKNIQVSEHINDLPLIPVNNGLS